MASLKTGFVRITSFVLVGVNVLEERERERARDRQTGKQRGRERDTQLL